MALLINLTLDSCAYENDTITKQKNVLLNLNKKCLFSISEPDNVFATFSFNNEDTRIFIERYDNGEMMEIISGERFQLSSGREDLGCYFPGYFSISIESGNEKEDYLFLVNPANMNYESVLHIRDFINDFYYGLSNDISKLTAGKKEKNIQTHIPNAAEKYNFLLKNLAELVNYADQYSNRQKAELVKQNSITNVSKINRKSIQWLLTKGMEKNSNIYSPEKILSSKSRLDRDSYENRIFKSELVFWNREISSIIQSSESYVSMLLKRIEELETGISNLSESVTKQEQIRQVNSYVKKSDRCRLEEMKKDRDRYFEDLNDQKSQLGELRKYQRNIVNILYNSWVSEVTDSVQMRTQVYDYRLKSMIGMRNEYLGISRKIRKASDSYVFGEKCTPKLFETYIYVLLIKMLVSEGYEIENYSFEKDNVIPILSNQSRTVLTKDSRKCVIEYDYELKKSNEKLESDEFVTINSHYNRPDFIVSFFDDGAVIPEAVVVEVKWRPLSIIYNENGDTEIVTKLKDYYALAYHVEKPKRKTNRGIIQKVFVVYPDIQQRITQIQENEIIGVGLDPTADVCETDSYQELKNQIFSLSDE